MFDHMGFRVRDLAAARRFYEAVAPPLGLHVVDNTASSFVLTPNPDWPVPFVWIGTDRPAFWREGDQTSASPIHLALQAADRGAVAAFHRAAIAAGGTDNGAPGPRGPAVARYYAAFVLDPDGNNIEAGVRE
ncbi:MAG: VOC family protein [Phenylobacterium sp.]|uniref:VOC family protein n=1 Tax=Phenylobacterium sp. TaxID=1871053 RepID=UPI001A4A7D64|nr:VOC family protein [Phenylobacterium sp.]MBL8553724.1 VOC family protein [Phenylobacterium sp.]